MKAKRTRKRLIPVPIYIISMTLILLILTFGIYFGIEISKANLDPLLKSKLNYENTPTIYEATEKRTDGFKSSSSNNLTYSYVDLGLVEVGLACNSYKSMNNDKNGTANFYVGVRQKKDSNDVKLKAAKLLFAEKWSQYASSAGTYGQTINKNQTARFTLSKTITLTLSESYPQRFLLGMKKVSHPNVYFYIEYVNGDDNYTAIIEYTFSDYFINGQSIIK